MKISNYNTLEKEKKYFDFTNNNGLVFCQNADDTKINSEILYIHEAKKLNATAILFRRFYKKEEKKPYYSEPAISIFEVEDNFFNSNAHIELHAKLWSSGKNEIYILDGVTRIDIINARRPAESNKIKELTIENLVLESSKTLEIYNDQRFSAHLFDTGTFWEQPDFDDKIDESLSPHIYLLEYLLSTRKSFQKNKRMELIPSTIDKLLVVCILIKFLEEIKDDNGKHSLKDIYKKLETKDLVEAVETGKLILLLAELSNEFNGKIFDKFSDSEKATIQKADLKIVANFLNADIDLQTNQFFLWKQYDFKYLPVEVISAIYENFIQAAAKRKNGETEKSVVYTPIHLVNFLIDEVMPLERADLFMEESFKVLDPACGSGVFLVAAYKRLLQWWAINNIQDGQIKYPKSKKAQKILEDNIFGVDVKETATFVSIFSLTTALLDKLSPQEIWNNLKFKDLSSRNIQCENFFDWALYAKKQNQSFDLVIGNPPFNIETGKKKSEVLNPAVLIRLNLKHKKIPNKNFALHFFEGSMILANRVCLIIPSNVLLYSKSSRHYHYRKDIFTDYSITKIFDFTHLRRDLFHKTADTPVVAVIAENIPLQKLKIEHTVIKRTISSEKKLRFEIDYYDRHYVQWEVAIDETKQFIWKANLCGGGRLFQFIYRLSLLPTLKSFIDKKIEEGGGWIYSSGYKIGGNTEKTEFSFIRKGHKILQIDESGNSNISKEGEKTNKFEFSPAEDLYKPPILIFDQRLGSKNIPVALFKKYPDSEFLYFNRDFVGIHAPLKDYDALQRIEKFVKEKYNQLYRLYVLVQSGSCMILTETEINKRDIDSLPFPDDEQFLQISKNEKIVQDDVLKYYIHFGKSIGNRGAGKIFHSHVDENQLKRFGEIFCNTLNDIYARPGKTWQVGTASKTVMFTIYQFGFGKNEGLHFNFKKDTDNFYENLIVNNLSNKAAIYNRVIRIYKHIDGYDCLFLIKPNTLRYWLNSIALRDADDTFMDLKSAGF